MRNSVLFFALLTGLTATAQRRAHVPTTLPQDSLTIHTQQYDDALDRLLDRYRMADSLAGVVPSTVPTNPYFFPLISGGTLYNSPLQQSFALQGSPAQRTAGGSASPLLYDRNLGALEGQNAQLMQMYAHYPWLFTQTQEQMMQEGTLLTDVEKPIKTDVKISNQVQLTAIEHDVEENVAAIARKPNFWTFRGNASLQFTQSYFSDNWFQGGDNNYAALSKFMIEANYDNKRKLQWENKLEVQLGFQTAKSDTLHTLRVTSNLLRFTTKVGYKAFKNWYYTANFEASTQLYPNYKTNSNEVTTDFASPLHMRLALGMDYKLKKKRFEGSLFMAPVSVGARYVDRKGLRARYNDGPEQATKWTWGPNVVIRYNWKIIDNIRWDSRFLWFSDFQYTNIEWENTFYFDINKYLTCQLFVYPKFLDNNVRYKNDKGRYWMFKEWLSLGLSYSW